MDQPVPEKTVPLPTPYNEDSVPSTAADVPVIGNAIADGPSPLENGNAPEPNSHPLSGVSILENYFGVQASLTTTTTGGPAAEVSDATDRPKRSRGSKAPRAPLAEMSSAGRNARLHPYKAGGRSASRISTTESARVDTSQAVLQATGDGNSSTPFPAATATFSTAASPPALHGLILSPPLSVGRPLHEVYGSIINPMTEIREAVILPLVEHPFMAQMLSGVKDYEFRRYRMSHMVSHVYFYILAPASTIRYMASVKTVHSRLEDGPIPETGVGNKEFNERVGQWKSYEFAYKITGVFELDDEITLKDLKEKYGMKGAPRGLIYAPDKMKRDHGLDQMRRLW